MMRTGARTGWDKSPVHALPVLAFLSILVLSVIAVFPISGAAPEPKVLEVTPGQWRVEWNMTDLASYTLTNVKLSMGKAVLSEKVHEVGDTQPSDFNQGKHNNTNLSVVGQVILNNTGGTYPPEGDFRSRSFLATNLIGWGKIRWTADIPTGTVITLQTRTSYDNSTWSNWSIEYSASAGETVVSPAERYLQYRALLKTTVSTITPTLKNVTIEWLNYNPSGTIETKDHPLNGVARRGVVTMAEERNGQTITYRYSQDQGATWKTLQSNGVINGPLSGTIRFKMDIATMSGSVTPALDWLAMNYGENQPPVVQLEAPKDGTGTRSSVDLVWNASDPEDDQMTFDVFMGQTEPLSKVASALSGQTCSMDVVTGNTYKWYIVATDSLDAEGKSPTWTFTVNDPPEVGLRSPANFSTLVSEDVILEWWAKDPESNSLTFKIFVTEITMVNTTTLTSNGSTTITFHGQDEGTYKWYVEAFDGFNTAISEEMYFNIMVANAKPYITSSPVTLAYTGQQYVYQVKATDPDNGPFPLNYLKFSVGPEGLVVDLNKGLATWTPLDPGDYHVSIKVSDGKDFVLHNYTIHVLKTIIDKTPTFSDIPPLIVKGVDTEFDLGTYVTDDMDVPANMTWTASSRNESLLNASASAGKLKIVPTGETGMGRVLVTVTDHGGNVASVEISIDVKEKTVEKKTEMQMLQEILCQPLVIALFVIVVAVGVGYTVYRKWSEGKFARTHLPGSMETKVAAARLDAIEAEEAARDLDAMVKTHPRAQPAVQTYEPVQSYQAVPGDEGDFGDSSAGFRARGFGPTPVGSYEYGSSSQSAEYGQSYVEQTAVAEPVATGSATAVPVQEEPVPSSGPAYQKVHEPAYVSLNPPIAGKAYEDMESMPADSGVKPKEARRPEPARPKADKAAPPAATATGPDDSITEILERLNTTEKPKEQLPAKKKEPSKENADLQDILSKL